VDREGGGVVVHESALERERLRPDRLPARKILLLILQARD